jgi:hypothetical protein
MARMLDYPLENCGSILVAVEAESIPRALQATAAHSWPAFHCASAVALSAMMRVMAAATAG